MGITKVEDVDLNYIITMNDKSTDNHDIIISRCKDDFNAVAIAMRIANSYYECSPIIKVIEVTEKKVIMSIQKKIQKCEETTDITLNSEI